MRLWLVHDLNGTYHRRASACAAARAEVAARRRSGGHAQAKLAAGEGLGGLARFDRRDEEL